MTTLTKLSHADTMKQFGLVSCDFTYNPDLGISFTVYAEGSEPDSLSVVTPLFDYDDDDSVQSIKDICLAVIDDGFADIPKIAEVGGTFVCKGNEIIFEGNITTMLSGVTAAIR